MTQTGWRPHIALGLLLMTTALVYWPGLRGPLLLDDFVNLNTVTHYLEGRKTAAAVIFGNTSGPLGRPISMASFVLDAKLFGSDIWYAKRTSLAIHLLIGLLLFAIFRRILVRDPLLARHLLWLPALLAAVWLVLPIHVSTVLYLVQRMAMLSALFVLAGIWTYLWARDRIDRDQSWGTTVLWLGVPACTALAMFSKENGALLPLMVLVIELTLFRPVPGARRPRSVLWFFALTVAAPALMALATLVLFHDRLLLRYERREFTLGERLLTQVRILWDYVLAILVPQGPRLGLFHDHYPKSSGLLHPWTTLVGLIAWLVALAAAWKLRRAAPVFTAGIGLFLAGHALESTIVPLELYFEHRNYLPSFALLLAVVGCTGWVATRLPVPSATFRRAIPILLLLPVLAYAWVTHGRAHVWSSESTLLAQELRHNPDSPRMRAVLVAKAIRSGNAEEALIHIDAAESNWGERQLATATLWRFAAHCAADRTPPEALYQELADRFGDRIESFQAVAWELLASMIASGTCPRFESTRLIDLVEAKVLGVSQSPRQPEVWRSVIALAGARAAQLRFDEAAALAYRGWRDSDEAPNPAIFAFQLNATIGNTERCTELLRSLEKHYGKGDARLDAAVESFQQALLNGTIEQPRDAPIREPDST